ncbi:MAG: hypothetical protein OXI22_11265 [Defluviicoccus sp.]|nr:hypothetical protein [Defluviicoccus sp.]MDE0384454.1 hypothetical protein [Defluviicoccus sp.]
MTRGAALALALAVLAACQPLPRPFAPTDRGGAATAVPGLDAWGVALRPVSGMAPGPAAVFTASVVAALRRRGVPAAVSGATLRSALVYGAAETRPLDGERLGIAIAWTAFGREGRGLGLHRVAAEAPRRDWESAAAPLLERLAAQSADGIVALLRPAAPVPHRPGSAIRVGSVAAPPGLEGEILRRAMVDALRAARIGISPSDEPSHRLAATVSLGPVWRGQRRLRVEWRLDDAAGGRIGAMVQENDVAEGTLAADWPALARLIARAAVDELGGLLARTGGSAAAPVDGPARRP